MPRFLPTNRVFQHFEYRNTVDSTNVYLRRFTEEGMPRVVVAGEQTGGRGRQGRNWYSPTGKGLYVSYLFYPDWNAEFSPFLNMMSALSVICAIREYAGNLPALRIKAPNDILVGGRKVGGVLSELSSLSNRIQWAIIGIGINLYQKRFPAELQTSATSLTLEGVVVSHPLDLYDTLTRELETHYQRLEMGHWAQMQEEFDEKSADCHPA